MISVNYDNFIDPDKIISITTNKSQPASRMIQEAKKFGMFVDASAGRSVKSIVVMNDGKLIGSAASTETLKNRVDQYKQFYIH